MPMARDLRRRWLAEPNLVRLITDDLREQRDWTRWLIQREDGTPRELVLVSTCGRPTMHAEAAPRDLRGFPFQDIDLSRSDVLADCALDYSLFQNVQLTRASLNGSSLSGVMFAEGCSLAGAQLRRCDLRGCRLTSTSLAAANLTDSDLRRADLRHADLRGAVLRSVRVNAEPALGRLTRPRGWTRFGGEYQTAGLLSRKLEPALRRRIAAESDALLLRREHPILARMWHLAANYGRSPARLAIWAALTWFLFAVAYAALPVWPALRGTPAGAWLREQAPTFARACGDAKLNVGDAFALSTVTILGSGDVGIDPLNSAAQILTGVEAAAGVVLLGMFVAVLLQVASVRSD